MSEETKTAETLNVTAEYLKFLQEQFGGQEAAEMKFRQRALRMFFSGRQSDQVTMGEIIDHIESQGGTKWLRGISIIGFLSLFKKPDTGTSKKSKKTSKKSAKKPVVSKVGRNTQERIDKLMAEFEKTPWLTKASIGELLGVKATPTVDSVISEALNRGLIKKHRGRVMTIAKATETCPPPA